MLRLLLKTVLSTQPAAVAAIGVVLSRARTIMMMIMMARTLAAAAPARPGARAPSAPALQGPASLTVTSHESRSGDS